MRAAGELRLRLADLLGEHTARGVTAATFHSVCARMLREHAGVFGRTDAYTIYDQADVRRVIEPLLADRAARRDPSRRYGCADGRRPPSSRAEIALAKSRLLAPERYAAASRSRPRRWSRRSGARLEDELERCNAFGFDDLLVFAVRLLREHPRRLAHLRARWRWLLVDEMQDTNDAQAALVHLLAGPQGNVTVVGDDDQAIYRFRSAEPRNILDFGERYPDHAQIVLGRNFRSRAEILTAAVACIAHNQQRHPKALLAVRGPGGRVRRAGSRPTASEAAWVAGLIADALAARHRRRRRSSCSRAPATPPARSRPRWPPPGSRTACSARSACTSAPRSATRSPTSRCWPTRATRTPSAARSRRRGAASARATIGRVVAPRASA